jgi:hypothetical protein
MLALGYGCGLRVGEIVRLITPGRGHPGSWLRPRQCRFGFSAIALERRIAQHREHIG